jgi:Ni/Co efflux regulator RcnB
MENRMKKIATLVLSFVLGAGLALAQNTGGDKDKAPKAQPTATEKTKAASTTKTKKSHKGGKKGTKKTNAAATKKSSGGTTPPPK